MTKFTGTLIKNFYHCQRQAYLYYYGINFKSELTKIGKILHKQQNPEEFIFENLKVDDIKNNILIEYKKTSSNLDGTIMQVIYYLDYLNKKGITKTARIKDLTFGNTYNIELNEDNIKKLEKCRNEIIKLLTEKKIPQKLSSKKPCKGCSFKDYCWLE